MSSSSDLESYRMKLPKSDQTTLKGFLCLLKLKRGRTTPCRSLRFFKVTRLALRQKRLNGLLHTFRIAHTSFVSKQHCKQTRYSITVSTQDAVAMSSAQARGFSPGKQQFQSEVHEFTNFRD